MASSSRSHQTLKNSKNTEEEHNFVEEEIKVSKDGEQEKEEEEVVEEDWLKLGLGLENVTSCNNQVVHGSNPPVLYSPSPSSSHALISSSHDGLKLGLGFEQGSGLGQRDNEGLGSMEGIEHSGYGNSSYHCNYYHCYHHDNDDNGMKLWPSCQIHSQGFPMADPRGDSHHYRARMDAHQCGLWFTLRSSTNRSGEALPQIPKAYIRVRDENMTVFMVKKYLARKLGLSNEAEAKTSKGMNIDDLLARNDQAERNVCMFKRVLL